MPLKSDTLKLSPILAEYLYTHKELYLAGIGKFSMESLPAADDAVEKNTKETVQAPITFLHDTSVKEDASLVEFISQQTGKMKSLAASDLDSHLELAKQFLNIGKPFFIEGIGTLTKNKSEKFDFTPGNLFNEKATDQNFQDAEKTMTTEESFTDYEEMLTPRQRETPFAKKLVLFLATVVGIGLAVWGGFLIFKNMAKTEAPTSKALPVQITDTSSLVQIDSSANLDKNIPLAENEYRFVIEEADKLRALARFGDLKKWGIDVQMETKDSIIFKLFFKLSASAADTSRIKDSLNLLYGTRSRTIIEKKF